MHGGLVLSTSHAAQPEMSSQSRDNLDGIVCVAVRNIPPKLHNSHMETQLCYILTIQYFG